MKNIKHLICCFYCIYNSFFIVLCYFYRNFLRINMFILSIDSKKVFLSLNRFLTLYKPNILIQY